MSSMIAFIIAMGGLALIVVAIISSTVHGSLNIKAKTVGDGQYGFARWATEREIEKTYREIPYEPDKWRQGKHLPTDIPSATVLGFLPHINGLSGRIDISNSHTLILGDAFRDYAGIAQKYYGYTSYVIDLRNPTRSDGFNLLHLVNKYMDLYKEDRKLAYKARAERYAKITAKIIVRMEGFDGGGQNAFFYDAAEGLIASTILLVSEFCGNGQRHIVSVFKVLRELLQVKDPVPKAEKDKKVKPKNEFQKLIDLLPDEHKAKWLASAALLTSDSSLHSVISTAISRLLSFIDSELEQILCFDSAVDSEQFCKEKVAVFIVFPEEDVTKYFLVSLFVSQLYNECLTIANQNGKNRLDRQVKFYLDEFGTMPKFDSAEQMFTAGKSRNIILYPMIQSLSQMHEKYGREGGDIIIDCCTNVLIGGFSPLSKGAEEVSRALGTQTVQSGSVSHSSNCLLNTNNSNSVQMIQKPLMTAEQILHMPEGQWILTKTRNYPMLTTMKRFTEWGIQLNCPFKMEENAARPVKYATEKELFKAVLSKYMQPMPTHEPDKPDEFEQPIRTRRSISNDLII